MFGIKLIANITALTLCLMATPWASAEVEEGIGSISVFRAEIRGPEAIWVTVRGSDDQYFNKASDYRLTDAAGREIAVAEVFPNERSTLLLVPGERLNIKRVHYLEMPEFNQRVRVRFDGWFRTLYSSKPLGANVSADLSSTRFAVFAPRAEAVNLYLYDGPDDAPDAAKQLVEMIPDEDGVFEATLPGNLAGTYYDFTAHGPDDPGNQFYEQVPVHLNDPYGYVQMEAFGKSRVSLPITPASPVLGGRPAMQDVVAYEVHVQDFTDLLPIDVQKKGTISGMAVPGLKNSQGEPVGFDYLVDLGINVVHLLPVQEFHHYPDDEWKAAFADDPEMKALGIDQENYQWGYSTTHAFAIENRYREKGTEPGAEQEQFRDLVQAFHDKGIAVIIDIVPNHTGEDMRGGKVPLNFNGFDRQYYYRTDDAGQHIGPYGNEVKTEDRPMVQRWLVDQAKYFVEAYGVDGFRIDLAGQLDEQSLHKLMAELPDDIIIYGEPWIDVTDPFIRGNEDWDWYKKDSPITFFQDDARNAFKGSPFLLDKKLTDRGFAGGNGAERENAMKGLANDYPEEARSPTQGLNYLDIHDNWALADRFAKENWDGRTGVDEGPFKIAATLLFTSQGPIVIHGGTEIMRTKGASVIEDVVKYSSSGEVRLKGRDDTYNQRVPNQFQWETVGKKTDTHDYAGMHAFWKGLIALRLSEAGAVFRHDRFAADQYQWLTPETDTLLGYTVSDKVFVLLNVGQEKGRFDSVTLPAGDWQLVGTNEAVDHINGVQGDEAMLIGGETYSIDVPATSLRIWLRK